MLPDEYKAFRKDWIMPEIINMKENIEDLLQSLNFLKSGYFKAKEVTLSSGFMTSRKVKDRTVTQNTGGRGTVRGNCAAARLYICAVGSDSNSQAVLCQGCTRGPGGKAVITNRGYLRARRGNKSKH